MPISYSIDLEKQVIFEVWKGDITSEDVAHYWRTLLGDPQALLVRRTLVDLRECNLLFQGSVFPGLIAEIVQPLLSGRDWKTAIVVGGPVHFGVSRQYQVFAESFSQDSIFNEYDLALEWLMQQKVRP